MKIVEEFPKEWGQIVKFFPQAEKSRQFLVTVGDTCYNPYKIKMSQDMVAHEQVHVEQQKQFDTFEKYLQKYAFDSEFRFNMELEAYRAQLFVLRQLGRQRYREYLHHYAKILSGPMYNNVCRYEYALNKLKQNFNDL